MLPEEDADIVDVGHLDAGGAERALQRQLDRLLGAPDDQVPGPLVTVALGLFQDPPGLAEMAPGEVDVGQSSKTSPGLRSGLSTQYRTRPRRRRWAPSSVSRARRRASTARKKPSRSWSSRASSTMSR